jgi:hypothetical protein
LANSPSAEGEGQPNAVEGAVDVEGVIMEPSELTQGVLGVAPLCRVDSRPETSVKVYERLVSA